MVATERRLFELLDASAAADERIVAVLESVVHHWPESDAFVSELSALRHSSDERSEGVSARELLAWKDVLAELGSIVDDVATATRALHAIELKG